MDSALAYLPAYLLALLLTLYCVGFLLVRTWRRLFS